MIFLTASFPLVRIRQKHPARRRLIVCRSRRSLSVCQPPDGLRASGSQLQMEDAHIQPPPCFTETEPPTPSFGSETLLQGDTFSPASTCHDFTPSFTLNRNSRNRFLSPNSEQYVLIHFSLTADFGLSKIIDDQVTMKTVCGTPGYCGECITSTTLVHY